MMEKARKYDEEKHDIVDWEEILRRLPIKSVFRFKCVSNQWNSLISNPIFTQSYISMRLDPSDCSSLPWTLLHRDTDDFPDKNKFPPYYVNKSLYSHEIDLKFSVLLDLPPHPDKYTVLSSSNGLLLCFGRDSLMYYVCNPLTKQWIALPRDNLFFIPPDGEGFVTQVDERGMVTSYRVVQLQHITSNRDCVSTLEMNIFASEIGKWRIIRVHCPRNIELRKPTRPVSLNGILHWFDYSNQILAYDPYNNNDQCRLIKLPNRMKIQPVINVTCCITDLCDVSQGRLQYFVIDAGLVKMWVLEDYDNGIWNLKHAIKVCDILTDITNLTLLRTYPLAFHPFDSAIVYLHRRRSAETTIFSYNIGSKRLELLYSGRVFPKTVLSAYSVLPVVHPLWPQQIPLPGSNQAI